MKFKINKDGKLEMWRKFKYQLQLCPFTKDFNCGDSCPLFSEPISNKITSSMYVRQIEIKLCQTLLICLEDDFIDERI